MQSGDLLQYVRLSLSHLLRKRNRMLRCNVVVSRSVVMVQVELRQFVNELMVKTGGCAAAGWPIASCKIYPDKSYAFLEFRSVEEATNCMAFDGAGFKDSYLRVRHWVTRNCAVGVACAPWLRIKSQHKRLTEL